MVDPKSPPDNVGKTALEPWHVEDNDVLPCVPKGGFLKEYLDYSDTTCDGPLWFQLGGALTVLSAVAGHSDAHIYVGHNRYGIQGLNLWSATVGLSGSRKSQAIKPAMEILRNISGETILATDGSPEAMHDGLEAQGGVGLLWRNEMLTLFNQARRSYSAGLPGWMLEGYEGGPQRRKTISGGVVNIPRVRLSVLGNIPPSVLQQETSRKDWRSGFLPRFLFWGARIQEYMKGASVDLKEQQRLGDRLSKYILGRRLQVVINETIADMMSEWCHAEIDLKSGMYPDELYAALIRLQSKGNQLAALYTLARLDFEAKDGTAIECEEEDMLHALRIIRRMKVSTVELFARVGGTDEATMEHTILACVKEHPGCTTTMVASMAGISIKLARSILLTLCQNGIIREEAMKFKPGKGRSTVTYLMNYDGAEETA